MMEMAGRARWHSRRGVVRWMEVPRPHFRAAPSLAEPQGCRSTRPRGSSIDWKRWPMALKLNIGKCTLLGNYRENNEDAIEVKHFPDLDVCIVADGMGGQAA